MNNMLSSSQKTETLSVSQITAMIRGHLEKAFPSVTVEGEIGTWSVAPSGHAYFALKDDGAVLGCVLFRGGRQRLPFQPAEGMKVECRGRVSVFEKRGQYQLIVDAMRQSGEGELWAKFLRLKEKLEKEGLFEPSRKRELPRFPRTVGIVTSARGAAIRDMINVIGRRAPSVSLLICPARVQGDGAGAEIAQAIEKLERSGRIDVLIAGRGGGSVEDLWEFNGERVARAIYKSTVPVVSAVGHETDFTIADFVADLRAPTPSAAAELVTAGYVDLREFFHDRVERLDREMAGRTREIRTQLRGMLDSHALRRPELLLREYQQRADTALRRLPELVLRLAERRRARVERLNSALEGHNPELILKKGYAIVRRGRDGRVLMSASRLRKNLPVDLQFRDGKKRAVVTDNDAPDLFE